MKTKIDPKYYSFDQHKRECPWCGKTHYPEDIENYVYKRVSHSKNNKRLLYFCSYTCVRAYDKDLEEKRKKRVKKTFDPKGKHCIDCRYCKEDELGYKCTTYSQIANVERNACRRFKPKGDK